MVNLSNRVMVKRSRAGLGLFAKVDLKKGTRIIEYIGEHITPAEADHRGGKYLFTLNKKIVIDGKSRDNLARYINHSCRPNCYAEVNAAETRVFIFAKRAIKADEELSYHYGKEYFDDLIKPIGCRCLKCQG